MRKLLALGILMAMASVGLIGVPAAQAATTKWLYAATTGATYVNALNSTVSSDLTAQTYITGADAATDSNSTAGVDVAGLLSVGAAQTTTSAAVSDAGLTLTSHARTAGVSLLGGLITADAVDTTVTTTASSDGTTTAAGDTSLVNLKIAGLNLPVTIPKYFTVNIPGIATVTANYVLHAGNQDAAMTHAWGLGIQLLTAQDGLSAGATILINPLHHYVVPQVPSNGARFNGFAFSSQAQAHVGNVIKVVSDPTAYQGTPIASSNGATLTNTVATANIPGLATLGTLTSTSWSTKDAAGNGEVLNTNNTAGLNVLGGLIKADAIGVSADGKLQDGVWTSTMKMTLLNLVIAGQKIPINVSPNTSIDVAGLGKVTINKQGAIPGANINRIDGIEIVLDTAKAGLPAGAVIDLASAATIVTPPGS